MAPKLDFEVLEEDEEGGGDVGVLVRSFVT
jgi:hypothetical protein